MFAFVMGLGLAGVFLSRRIANETSERFFLEFSYVLFMSGLAVTSTNNGEHMVLLLGIGLSVVLVNFGVGWIRAANSDSAGRT